MDNIKNTVIGGAITLLIGGAAFTFSKEDVVNNFVEDTGVTHEQAEQYVNSIPEEDLGSWTEIGTIHLKSSEETLALSDEIDCLNYEYEWETITLTCNQGKSQLKQIASTENLLGRAFIKLDASDATENDISNVVFNLDRLNSDYELEIIDVIFESSDIDDLKKTNSYNKSILKAALESN